MIVALDHKPRGIPKRDRLARLRYRIHRTTDRHVTVWGPLLPVEGGWVNHPCARYRSVLPEQVVEVDG